MTDALFERLEANTYLPTEFARGPWSPDALHGGPIAALVAGTGAEVGGLEEDGLAPVRLTLELVRPVPIAPLTVTARLQRPGRKVRLASVEVTTSEGTVVAAASLLAIRQADVLVPEQVRDDPPPGPDTVASDPARLDIGLPAAYQAFHNSGVEHRFVSGGFDQPGPAIDWIRLAVPVVAGEPVSPLQRVAGAADFGNGVSGQVRFDELTFINPDLTIALHRLPEGEWVCLDARSYLQPTGLGLAESALWDEAGRLGRAVQTVLVERRAP